MPPAAPAMVAVLGLLFASVGLCAAPAATEEAGGRWVGGFRDGADWVYFQVRLEPKAEGLRGAYDLPMQFVSGQVFERLEVESGRIRFEIPRGEGRRWRFDGRLEGAAITGNVEHPGGGRSPFRLDRLAPTDPAKYTGTYRLDDGRVVHLRRWSELGLDGLLFVDSSTGRLGALFPSSHSTFFCGPSALVTYPVESVVTFEADGADGADAADAADGAAQLVWTSGDGKIRGRRVPLREEEVTFANGDVTLAGTLVLPEAGDHRRRHPAVVIAAGATAAGSREMGRHLADFFALHGVAVLVFDKRGTGASGGDWLKSGFEDLADDVLAGVNALRAREDIIPEQVGLLGFSQGGWVVALAAARSPHVAFIVSQSGPGVTPTEQELYRVEHWMLADGFAEADVRAALRLQRARDECARTGQGWDELARLGDALRLEPWYPYVGDTSGPDDPFWEFWRLIRDFDPVPALRNVRCPVLSIYGDKDTYLPVAKSAAIWGEALERAGNRDVTIKVFPDADHSLLEAKTGGLKESPYKRQFVDGALPLLRDWVLARVDADRG